MLEGRVRRDCFQSATSFAQPTAEEVQAVMMMCGFSEYDTAKFLGMPAWSSAVVRSWMGEGNPIPYPAWALLCAMAGLGQIWDFEVPTQRLTLGDLDFRIEEKSERRVYQHFVTTVTADEEPVVVEVNLKWLSSALEGDPDWASSRGERTQETFRPDRYARVLQEFKSERDVDMPYLNFSRGRTGILDGRHRLYAQIDLGYTHCPVVVDSEHADAVSSLADD